MFHASLPIFSIPFCASRSTAQVLVGNIALQDHILAWRVFSLDVPVCFEVESHGALLAFTVASAEFNFHFWIPPALSVVVEFLR